MKKNNLVKRLEMELWQHECDTHPALVQHAGETSFPIQAYIPMPSREDSTANGLTRCIIDFIKLRGGQAERVSIMGRPIKQANGNYMFGKSHMTKGTADISATIRGRSVKIEVKIGTDRQSDAQRKYQADIERAGGMYYIAKDFESFVEWYNKTFVCTT